MKNKNFNHSLFKEAISLIDKNPYEAVIRFENYIDEYPIDYAAYPFYISALIIIGKLKEASSLINKLDNMSLNKIDFAGKEKEYELFKLHLLESKIKLLSYQKKYTQMYQLCQKNKKTLNNESLKHIVFYSEIKSGKLTKVTRNNHNYLFRQIINYQEKDFLEHLKSHLPNNKQNVSLTKTSIFSEDFPITKILEEIKKYIPSENTLYLNFYDNKYIFKYDNCGKVDNFITDYFIVTCFHDTSDIITMCPCLNTHRLPYIDLNYLTESITQPKTKRLSQIDKFNKRYNK